MDAAGPTQAPPPRSTTRSRIFLAGGAALLAGLLAAGGGAAGVLAGRPVYESTAFLAVDQPPAVVLSPTEVVLRKITGLRSKYGALVPTAVIADPVAAVTGLTPGEVATASRVTYPRDSAFLLVTARFPEAYQAPRIAEGVANELSKRVSDEQRRAGVARASRVTLTRVLPTTPARKVSPSSARLRITSAVGGLLALVAVGFVAFIGSAPPPGYHGRLDADRQFPRASSRMVPRRIRLIRVLLGVGMTLVAGGLAAAVGVRTVLNDPVVYASRAALLIDQPQLVGQAGSEGVLVKLQALRFKYASLARTSAIALPAAQTLGVGEAQVAASAAVVNPPNSLLMVVVARSDDRAQAARMANAVADSLVKYLKDEQDRAKIVEQFRITLTSVQPAMGARQIEPDHGYARTRGIEGGLLGIVVGYIGYLITVRVIPGLRRAR